MDNKTEALLNKFKGYSHVGKWCIVRSTGQGVVYGLILSHEGQCAVVAEARQLYSWSSTFVLIELASYGPRKISEQRYGAPSHEPLLMTETCGIIPCSDRARELIDSVKPEEHP